MFNKMLMAALASTALASAPLLAAPGGVHGPPAGSAGANAAAGANIGGPAGAALDARVNSMGSVNASPTGIMNANGNSALSTGATMNRMFPGTKQSTSVRSGALAGLTTGMTLTSNGASVGTVQQVRTSADGTVRVVVVQGTNGRLFAIPAGKLSLSNGMLTTTARLNGVNGTATANPAIGVSQGPAHASANGIAHANAHSVLAGGTVVSGPLAGLTAGTTVQFNGNTVGTVSRVLSSADGTVRRVLVTASNGKTVSLSPTTLTFSGGVLTTTTFRGG